MSFGHAFDTFSVSFININLKNILKRTYLVKILERAAFFRGFLMMHDFFMSPDKFGQKNCQPDSRFADR